MKQIETTLMASKFRETHFRSRFECVGRQKQNRCTHSEDERDAHSVRMAFNSSTPPHPTAYKPTASTFANIQNGLTEIHVAFYWIRLDFIRSHIRERNKHISCREFGKWMAQYLNMVCGCQTLWYTAVWQNRTNTHPSSVELMLVLVLVLVREHKP